jgi:hypothetical protein
VSEPSRVLHRSRIFRPDSMAKRRFVVATWAVLVAFGAFAVWLAVRAIANPYPGSEVVGAAATQRSTAGTSAVAGEFRVDREAVTSAGLPDSRNGEIVISGRVNLPDGKPCSGATVTLTTEIAKQAAVTTAQDGTFSFSRQRLGSSVAIVAIFGRFRATATKDVGPLDAVADFGDVLLRRQLRVRLRLSVTGQVASYVKDRVTLRVVAQQSPVLSLLDAGQRLLHTASLVTELDKTVDVEIERENVIRWLCTTDNDGQVMLHEDSIPFDADQVESHCSIDDTALVTVRTLDSNSGALVGGVPMAVWMDAPLRHRVIMLSSSDGTFQFLVPSGGHGSVTQDMQRQPGVVWSGTPWSAGSTIDLQVDCSKLARILVIDEHGRPIPSYAIGRGPLVSPGPDGAASPPAIRWRSDDGTRLVERALLADDDRVFLALPDGRQSVHQRVDSLPAGLAPYVVRWVDAKPGALVVSIADAHPGGSVSVQLQEDRPARYAQYSYWFKTGAVGWTAQGLLPATYTFRVRLPDGREQSGRVEIRVGQVVTLDLR